MARLITSLADHIWVADGGTFTMRASLEQLDIDDEPIWPRFVLFEPVRGLGSLPDMEDNREDNTESNGESPLKSYARGKTLTYSGRIYGRPSYPDGWVDCHAGRDLMLAALGPDVDTGVVQTGFMRIAPTITGHTDQSIFGGQCRSCEVVERIVIDSATETPSPYWFPFTFDLRMNDGRVPEYDPDLEEVVADTFKW